MTSTEQQPITPARPAEQLERVLAHLNAGALRIGPDERVLHCGLHAAALLGCPASEIHGRHVAEVLSERAGVAEQLLSTALRAPFRAIVWTERGPHPRTLRAQAVKVGARLWVIIDDISERVHRAHELNQLHRAVEELQDDVLSSDSVTSLTHDLRNVMTVLSLELERHTRQGLPLEGAVSLARETLQLLRLLGPKPSLELSPVCTPVHEHVNDMMLVLRSYAGPTCELRLALDAATDRIALSARELQSVLMNLIVNARQAGATTIGIQTSNQKMTAASVAGEALLPDEYFVLQARDNGHGMSNQSVSLAFEPGFTTRADGSGTGLARVQRLARRVRGDVTLRSHPREGTEVTIYLPVVASESR